MAGSKDPAVFVFGDGYSDDIREDEVAFTSN
jgi:hypothetical protein